MLFMDFLIFINLHIENEELKVKIIHMDGFKFFF